MKKYSRTSGKTPLILLVIAIAIAAIVTPPLVGIFPFGPKGEVTAKVTRTYVDISTSSDSEGRNNSTTHYMVGTDKGVFEVDNSILLWVWNADEIYASLEEGKTYRLTTKGRKLVNFIFQEYPRILQASEVTTNLNTTLQ